MKRPRVSITNVVAVLLALAVGFKCAEHKPGPERIFTEIVQVPSRQLVDSIHALELQVGSLGARLRGLEQRRPETELRGTETVGPPPACVLTVRWDSRGRLDVGALAQLAVDSTPRYQPSLFQDIQAGDCDDGLSIAADGTVVCNRPRFGHLGIHGLLGAELSAAPAAPSAALGLSWRPTYRSPWSITAEGGMTALGGRFTRLDVRRVWRIF